ncbi:hypothetical protein C8R47DRAFT_1255539 [Mycena vitilis]|nr:hypothetical protein C8R47DRAFT_1255539 [Mycena vitilis]
MDPDEYFEEDDFDDLALQQLDAIEAAHSRPVPAREPSFEHEFLPLDDIDPRDLERIDGFIEASYRGTAQEAAALRITASILSPLSDNSPSMLREAPTPPNPGKRRSWDRTKLAENIKNLVLNANKPPAMKLRPDLLEARHWIYPLNQPKRDYQYAIVERCLFDNTIVALPTGLGKTFIAGVVMLNSKVYRWFPKGKVVFLAPSKPLVAQQADAFRKTSGIPGSKIIMLTGDTPKATRARVWKDNDKRVFCMTPQTLKNDLTSRNCDAKDIILAVFGTKAADEAHHATGDHAYSQIIRFMMENNPHFRVLGLTATPGADRNAVQALIDGLHISRIEIRDEASPDLKPYIHDTSVLKPLQQKNMMYGSITAANLHPFAATARRNKLKPNEKWAFTPLTTLASLARARCSLVEGTLGMCYNAMRSIGLNGQTNPLFRPVLDELELQKLRGFALHPKMEHMKALVLRHFVEKHSSDGQTMEQTNVIIFVTHREAVDEIVDVLNREQPTIRATRFVGQGKDTNGGKGLAQTEQLEILSKFKDGGYNVLVATSIGEEGLDISEVDLIVCYDAQKTPIRMLQRLGRTGRKRDGKVHVLLSEGREEGSLDQANATYKAVQKAILCGDKLELYGDVERLLPDHVIPQCLQQEMKISRGTKRRRYNDDTEAEADEKSAGLGSITVNDVKRAKTARNIATDSVATASRCRSAKAKVNRGASPREFPATAVDQEDDMEIEWPSSSYPQGNPSSRHSSSTAVAICAKTDSDCFGAPEFASPQQNSNASSLSEAGKDLEIEPMDSSLGRDIRTRTRSVSDEPTPSLALPESSLPVRPPRRLASRPLHDPGSPATSSHHRLHRRPSPSRRRRTPFFLHQDMYDIEADHSGQEVSEGSTDEPLRDSDLEFCRAASEPRASHGYDQSFVYRQSLLSQEKGGGRGVPHFAKRPVRGGMFASELEESSRRCVQLSSSPSRDSDEEPDEYEHGSFVVPDEEDSVERSSSDT